MMNRYRSIFIVLIMQLALASTAMAGDFDWLPKLDISAKADLPGFSASLSTRFNVGSAEIKTVIGKVEKPSDAYMVLRLGELSHQSPEYVLQQYNAHHHQGWGALAKSLGIKPGSREFHELKAGHDLHMSQEDHNSGGEHGHGNSHGHGKGGHGHGKNK